MAITLFLTAVALVTIGTGVAISVFVDPGNWFKFPWTAALAVVGGVGGLIAWLLKDQHNLRTWIQKENELRQIKEKEEADLVDRDFARLLSRAADVERPSLRAAAILLLPKYINDEAFENRPGGHPYRRAGVVTICNILSEVSPSRDYYGLDEKGEGKRSVNDQFDAIYSAKSNSMVRRSAKEAFLSVKNHLESTEYFDTFFDGFIFIRAKLAGCHFEKANFHMSYFHMATVGVARFSNCVFVGSRFFDTEATDVTFHETYHEATQVSKCRFEQCVLLGCWLKGCSFSKCALGNSEYVSTTLDTMHYHECDWSESWFHNSQMKNVVFRSCLFGNVRFEKAQLNSIHFESTDLRGAVFARTDLIDCKFNNSDLRGADFSKLKIEDVAQTQRDFENAIYDQTTKWPENFIPTTAIPVDEEGNPVETKNGIPIWEQKKTIGS